MNQRTRVLHNLLQILISLGLLLMLLALPESPAKATSQADIKVSPTSIENKFPDFVKFKVKISSEVTLEKAWFVFSVGGEPYNAIPLDVTPGKLLHLEYIILTHKWTIFPSTPIAFHWDVFPESGEKISSAEEVFYYDDTRFKWKRLEGDAFTVVWHDRPPAFGEQVAKAAELAMADQARFYGVKLEKPIQIVIYNTEDEYTYWFRSNDWSWGSVDVQSGITAQVVEEAEGAQFWLNNIIPHEISHLYFYQVTHNALNKPPVWLNEGLAQYNEFVDNRDCLEEAQKAMLAGDYIPLDDLSDWFTSDIEAEIDLSYCESYSAVYYMVNTYGEKSLLNLLAAYKRGDNEEKVFSSALGVNPAEFEQDWMTWVGVPADLYITPQPEATLLPKPATPVPTPTALFASLAAKPMLAVSIPSSPLRYALCPAWLLGAGGFLGLVSASAALTNRLKKTRKSLPPAIPEASLPNEETPPPQEQSR